VKKLIYLSAFLVIATFLMQGFQCASPEMTTAKIALQNKDWRKAKEFFEKELEKNHNNGEAWIMLTEVNQQLNLIDEAVSTILKGEKYIVSKDLTERVPHTKYAIYGASYNKGVEYLNDYLKDKNESDFKKFVESFGNCIKLRPNSPDVYRLLAIGYEAKGDFANANLNNNKYADLLKTELEIAKEKGLNVNMERSASHSILGAPIKSMALPYGEEGDSVIIDAYLYKSKELIVYSLKEHSNPIVVTGWRADLPKDITIQERFQPFTFSTSPYFSLAQYFFDNKDWDNALQNIFAILYIDPQNIDANTALILIYESQGKKEESLKYIQELVQKNPNNPSYLVQHADLLQQLEKFDESIEQYEKAIKIDPKNDNALRNIASAYKNKVLVIQKEQQEKVNSDRNYKPNPDEYMPLLRKSAEYFELCRKTMKFSRDFDVLAELAEIYTFTKETDKQKYTIAELEALEETIPLEQLERYYSSLVRLYDRIGGRAEDSERLQKKILELRK
jgi:tetratricopeptide (TPR) repeat protein